MSVIFNTLKKLESESEDTEKRSKKIAHRKRIYFFKKALHSPSSVFLLFFVCIAIGTGTLYGYFQLRDATNPSVKGFSISNSKTHGSADVYFTDIEVAKESQRRNPGKPSGLNQIEYLPKKENHNAAKTLSSRKPVNSEIRSTTVKETSAISERSIKKNAVVKIQTEQISEPSTGMEVSPVPEVEKVFLANANKNAKISRLVDDIRWEMENGDKQRTEKLIDELARIKGQKNNYVLKLKAVCNIHHQEYERAADILKTILTKNELDLEAGINMAIVEIKTKQAQKAYQRLAKLQTVYPENVRLAQIIQNLKLLFNEDQIRQFRRHSG